MQLAGALYDNGNALSCQPLIDWLRVALVRQADGQLSRLARLSPNVPLATPVFTKRRLSTVQRDLPSLGGGGPGPGGNLAIATHLGELVADLRQNRINDEARRALESERTPKRYYGAVGVAKPHHSVIPFGVLRSGGGRHTI